MTPLAPSCQHLLHTISSLLHLSLPLPLALSSSLYPFSLYRSLCLLNLCNFLSQHPLTFLIRSFSSSRCFYLSPVLSPLTLSFFNVRFHFHGYSLSLSPLFLPICPSVPFSPILFLLCLLNSRSLLYR